MIRRHRYFSGKKTKAVMTIALSLVLVMGALPALSVTARAEQQTGPGVVELTEEEQAKREKLLDSRLEWDEIEALVELQSPAWLEATESYQKDEKEYTGACDLYKERMQEEIDTVDEQIDKTRDIRQSLRELAYGTIVDEKGTTREQAIKNQEEAERLLQAKRREIRKTIADYVMPVRNMLGNEASALEPTKTAIVAGLQTTVISYQQMKIEKDLVDAYANLMEAQLNAKQASYALGLSSADDVESAQLGLEQARQSAQEAATDLEKLKSNLEQNLGFSEGALTEIGEVPEPDTAFFDTIDREEDLETAFAACYELAIAETKFSKYGTEELQNAAIRSAETSVRNTYESNYAALREARTAYEDALSAQKEADRQLSIAKEKYQRGMISLLELRQVENSRAEAQAAFKLSALRYGQVIDTYQKMLIIDLDIE